MPETDGPPLRVSFRADLQTLWKRPVHAGTDIKRRQIFLDYSLRSQPLELRRILVHELFHFAWVRLGNPVRESYAMLLACELERHARGELGWSAESRKRELALLLRSRRWGTPWREYICESFCDSAAWLYSGIGDHAEFTLARRHRKLRALWFAECFRHRKLLI